MIETVYLGMFAAGVSLTLIPILSFAFSRAFGGAVAWSLRWKLRPQLRGASGKFNLKRAGEHGEGIVLLGGLLAGFLFGLLISGFTASARGVPLITGGLGAGAAWFLRRNFKETVKMRKLREVAALYESVVFYTKAGYTIQQSLRLGAVIAPTIRPAVERCLAMWPSGPVRALEKFAEEVDVPEAATLSTVLMHAEESGMGYGRGAVEEESRALEALRQMLAELKIVSKPLYYCIYRALPLAAIAGMVVGPLVWRLIKVMGQYFGFLT